MVFVDRLLEAFFSWLEGPLVAQAAGQCARECRMAVWKCIADQVGDMTLAQARGYIRAVAPLYVAAEVDGVLACRRAGQHLRPRVVREAIEELVDVVADDFRFASLVQRAGAIAA